MLDNAHHSNKRKFNIYRSMDALEAATPIVAYPILSEEAGTATGKSVSVAHEDFMKQIGMEKHVEVVTPAEESQMQAVMEKAVGGELIDIQDIIKAKKNG